MKARDIQVGQRFRKRDRMPTLWEVAAIGEARDPIAHARLQKVGAPLDIKVVSLITLANAAYYTPVA